MNLNNGAIGTFEILRTDDTILADALPQIIHEEFEFVPHMNSQRSFDVEQSTSMMATIMAKTMNHSAFVPLENKDKVEDENKDGGLDDMA